MAKEPGSAKAKQASHAQEQRKRKEELRQERERILRQIENDKAERKEKEERRKALARAEEEESTKDDEVKSSEANPKSSSGPSNAPPDGLSGSKDCAIQIRLFDGSTIRNRFPVSTTLKGVRQWADGQRSDDVPYTFKQILSPLPNRCLSITEEEESLRSLHLVPSATLVMVPVQGYTSAYAEAGPGILSRGLAAGYGTVSAGAGLVTGALGTFLGLGRVTPQEEPGQGSERTGGDRTAGTPAKASGPSINVRTLRDQRDQKDDQQFYNGNQVRTLYQIRERCVNRGLTRPQLNFEPRKDEDKKED